MSARRFIVVGNDTEVGKTTITCQLIQLLVRKSVSVGAFKPAASGYPDNSPDSDYAQLLRALGTDVKLDEICPYRFERPVAPLVAARELGIVLSEEVIHDRLLAWDARCDVLFIETAGGLMSPLTEKISNLQFVKSVGCPAIVIIENRLGAINQANLVCSALLQHQVPVAAVIFNQIHDADLSLLNSNVELFQSLYERNFDASSPATFQHLKNTQPSNQIQNWLIKLAAQL